MSKEAIDYARALASELERLDERSELLQRQQRTLRGEQDAAYEKLLGVLGVLGQPLVIDGVLYRLAAHNKVEREPVIVDGAAAPKGKGYYDPERQSVMTWHTLGSNPPAEGRDVLLVRPKAPNVVWFATYLDGHWAAEGEDGLLECQPDDLWAELPLPPRAML